ncbi:hypothetical protein XAC3824_1230016 [Xanthomonas citri pv. citri]|nr:hypothetical protein XAC3824_1230016 [Xanthomonas citri pv. citri]CEE51660.1 hypothetical protein XAC71A_1330001 [Xanthomonas citri pv. citri]CEH50408.1 hypothetical protein XAC3615_14230014 [Xanthomonas citri pv. citri]CEL35679.1 hypothetical protein XAC4311_2470001 [Xanthomonas citri pv. citri]CEL42892.1 hypothetical protein XAC439_12120017 [Xanthomonas citri pv. citri]
MTALQRRRPEADSPSRVMACLEVRLITPADSLLLFAGGDRRRCAFMLVGFPSGLMRSGGGRGAAPLLSI